MDFSFNINEVLKEEITKLDSSLQPCRRNEIGRHGFQQLQEILFNIVDKMGEASAKAQGLHGPITSGKKLELAQHRLYILKDGSSNRGQGSVLGILKVGKKKLFVYDNAKVQHELEPLCILDFYVHESRQRMGCGRKLFDFMLWNEQIVVQHLAIDRPSSKFLSFLAKHYNLQATIPQVNNFVIFEGFFNNRADGRNLTFNPPHADSSTSAQDLNFLNGLSNWMTPASARQQNSYMGAAERMYSRHGLLPPNAYPVYSQARESTSTGVSYKKLNGVASPLTYYSTGSRPSTNNNFGSLPSIHVSLDQPVDPDAVSQMDTSISPLLQQDGPSLNYNRDHYQGRNGHLAGPPSIAARIVPDVLKPTASKTVLEAPSTTAARTIPDVYSTLTGSTYFQSAKPSWTVMGVLREQQMAAAGANGYQRSNRLW